MSYWLERLDSIIEEREKEESPVTAESISNMTLTKFESRNMAVPIYSEVLDCNIWFCSNGSMAVQVKQADPSSVCYTIEELRELIQLDPNSEDLKKIHETKSVFPNSIIIKSNKEKTDDPE